LEGGLALSVETGFVGEDVFEMQAAARSDLPVGQSAVFNEFHKVGATDTEEFGSLLGADFIVEGQHLDGFASSERFEKLFEQASESTGGGSALELLKVALGVLGIGGGRNEGDRHTTSCSSLQNKRNRQNEWKEQNGRSRVGCSGELSSRECSFPTTLPVICLTRKRRLQTPYNFSYRK